VAIQHKQGTIIEDMEVYQSALLLYERQKGTPSMSVLPLSAGMSRPHLPVGMCPSRVEQVKKHVFGCDADDTLSRSIRRVQMPPHVTELVPCANPDYMASCVTVRLSSMIRPEEVWRLHLEEPYSLQPVSSGSCQGALL
jgi:protease II